MSLGEVRTFRYVGGQKPVVELDGQDISSKLTGFSLEVTASGLADVVLYTTPRLNAEFDGLARVSVGEFAPGAAAATFLAGIDPSELERVTLARSDVEHGPGGLTKAMLGQLIEWATGG